MDREMDRSDDELSTNDSSVQEYTPGCFEGPEKTLEVVFYPTEGMPPSAGPCIGAPCLHAAVVPAQS